MPWTFPFQCFPCLGPSPPRPSKLQTNLLDKVCLDLCLTNLFKNADARAAKIHQNADKPCLPKLQTRFVCCRQMLSILDLALLACPCHCDAPQLIRQCSTAMLSLRHCSMCSGCWTVVAGQSCCSTAVLSPCTVTAALQYCRPAAAALLLRPALLTAIIGWNSRFICT